MMMKPITFMLLAAVVLVDVMNGSVMAHRTHLVATAEEVANESDTKLVAASYGRNAVVSSIVWAQLASGYEWLTRPFTDVEETRESEALMARTFGLNRLKKKLAIGFIPIAFKLGILSVVVFTILMLSLKSVFLGTTLLIINLGFIFAKIVAWKTQGESGHYGGHIEQWPQYGGSKNNDIHVHIHNPAPVSFSTAEHHQELPYSGHTAAANNYGPNIHIEPGNGGGAGGVGLVGYGSSSNGGWGGYKRARNMNYQF